MIVTKELKRGIFINSSFLLQFHFSFPSCIHIAQFSRFISLFSRRREDTRGKSGKIFQLSYFLSFFLLSRILGGHHEPIRVPERDRLARSLLEIDRSSAACRCRWSVSIYTQKSQRSELTRSIFPLVLYFVKFIWVGN